MTPEQEEHIRQSLTIDSDDKVSMGMTLNDSSIVLGCL